MNKGIEQRLYKFALDIVKLVRTLPNELAFREIGKQLLRAGTSIAANYEEAKGAFSKEDFAYKISICFKESRETNFWIRLLKDSRENEDIKIDTILQESIEIRNILGKSISTIRQNNI